MWIDTHCHLDAAEFSTDQSNVITRADDAGVSCLIIPAVSPKNFLTVKQLAWRQPHYAHHHAHHHVYALGIHPLYVADATPDDLQQLRACVVEAMTDVRFVAIGEIGLDGFIPQPDLEKQEFFYREQLNLAAEFNLPVLLHSRHAVDLVLKWLRRYHVPGGIAHAFNGSVQQAEQCIALGFKLGFGGAMTYPRALQIRRLARTLPRSSLVLETDAPDITPAWQHGQRNEPCQLVNIAAVLAELRDTTLEDIQHTTTHNACEVLPRLAALISDTPL